MGKSKKDKKRKRENDSRVSDSSSDQSAHLSTTQPLASTPGAGPASAYSPGMANMSSPTSYQAAISQLSQQMLSTQVPPSMMVNMQQHQMCQVISDMSQKLDMMVTKMTKLDRIDSTLNSIETKMKELEVQYKTIEVDVSQIKNNVKELEVSTSMAHDLIEDGNKQRVKTDSEIKAMRKDIRDLTDAKREMKDTILDIQSRSMRDNLLFFGMEEKEEEDPVNLVLSFCEEKLEFTDAKENVKIDRAHRIGRRFNGPNARPRPIVAKFNFHQDKERIRKSSYKLKDTPFGISEQFPREIQERRKAQMPIYKRARDADRKAVFVQDRLYIDGQLHRFEREQEVRSGNW